MAYSYNVDYWDGTSQLTVVPDMLKLRYANYPKDYFMGILPNSQYGSVAVLPSVYSPSGSTDVLVSSNRSMQNPSAVVVSPGSTSILAASSNPSSRTLFLNSDLSAL